MLFDWIVVGQVLPFNSASSVRGPKHVKSGKTPVRSAKGTRALLTDVVGDAQSEMASRERQRRKHLRSEFERRVIAAGYKIG